MLYREGERLLHCHYQGRDGVLSAGDLDPTASAALGREGRTRNYAVALVTEGPPAVLDWHARLEGLAREVGVLGCAGFANSTIRYHLAAPMQVCVVRIEVDMRK